MLENHFLEVKNITNSFTYEVQCHWNYVWSHEIFFKICFGCDRWCFLSVSKKTIVNGKSFFRSQKYHKLIYLWGSMPLKLCLVVHGEWLIIYFGSDRWCCLYVSKKTIVSITFNMLLHKVKNTTNSFTYDVQCHWNSMFGCTWKRTKNIFLE